MQAMNSSIDKADNSPTSFGSIGIKYSKCETARTMKFELQETAQKEHYSDVSPLVDYVRLPSKAHHALSKL